MTSLLRHCADDDLAFMNATRFRSDLDDDAFDFVEPRCDGLFADLPKDNFHLPAEIVREIAGIDAWNNYFKFSVVRNPWDWFVSLYWWHVHTWHEALARPSSPRVLLGNVKWRWRISQARRSKVKHQVERALRLGWFESDLERWLKFFLLDGRPCLDFYMRFEHLHADYGSVCRRLGLPIGPLPKTKTKIRKKSHHYRDCYTDWSRDYIARRYARVIEIFDYSF